MVTWSKAGLFLGGRERTRAGAKKKRGGRCVGLQQVRAADQRLLLLHTIFDLTLDQKGE